MNNLIWPAVLTVAGGICVLVQQALNANLRGALGSAAWSGVTSYVVGTIAMACLAAVLRDPLPAAGAVGRVPWWAWSGGIFGAIFIALSIVTIPRLGGVTFLALLVTGQMIAAIAFDQFGLLGIPQRPIDLPRLLGVALLVGAVVLIRR